MNLSTIIVIGFAIVILLLCVPFKKRKFVVFLIFCAWVGYNLLDLVPAIAAFGWAVFTKTPSWVWGLVFFVLMVLLLLIGWMLDRHANKLIKQEYVAMGGKLGVRGRERIQTLMRDWHYSEAKATSVVLELVK